MLLLIGSLLLSMPIDGLLTNLPYDVKLVSHASSPVLSSANPIGQRECCGSSGCIGHGQSSEAPVLGGAQAERISWADCDLLAGTCSDVDQTFNLAPEIKSEDPRAIYNDDDGWQYLFYILSILVVGMKLCYFVSVILYQKEDFQSEQEFFLILNQYHFLSVLWFY